jgi:hypothetical protein
MSELKAEQWLDYAGEPRPCYPKSEADKVIAELEESHKMEVEQLLMEIVGLKDKLRHYPIMAALLESNKKEIDELKDKLQAANELIENLINSASSIMLFQDRVKDDKCAELRHANYRRCLAMAKWCDEVMMSCELRGYAVHRIWANRHQWAMRWKYRWLELAKKFKDKEAK